MGWMGYGCTGWHQAIVELTHLVCNDPAIKQDMWHDMRLCVRACVTLLCTVLCVWVVRACVC
jgi:hypothetical protein